MSVREHLAFGLEAGRTSAEDRDRRIEDMMALMQIAELAEARPDTLSGGQKQRVALARTLVLRPSVLLMDEGFTGLDWELAERLRRQLLRLHDELGFTFLFVTHNRDEAREIGTRTIQFRNGRIQP